MSQRPAGSCTEKGPPSDSCGNPVLCAEPAYLREAMFDKAPGGDPEYRKFLRLTPEIVARLLGGHTALRERPATGFQGNTGRRPITSRRILP